MTKILLPNDGSAASARAIEQVLQRGCAGLELHLLNVQLPVDGNVRTFVNADELNAYHLAEGLAELAAARAQLDAAGVACQQHVLVGHPADQIRRFADENGFDEIVMGTHGRTGLMHLLMGSVAAEVSEQAKTQVTLVK
ncbi:universal stress protein [Malikia sp.]|uniref:universal stress protein n=1 Tax=Malikia sp. TaxID=2070706 RepID=UPI00263046D2|nr:universal stress protein [Malikia sp.]MDD2728222.1 universal stress protein [Malikia sp.]